MYKVLKIRYKFPFYAYFSWMRKFSILSSKLYTAYDHDVFTCRILLNYVNITNRMVIR